MRKENDETQTPDGGRYDRFDRPVRRGRGRMHGGAGAFRGVLPVGVSAVLDADAQTLQIVENVVEA